MPIFRRVAGIDARVDALSTRGLSRWLSSAKVTMGLQLCPSSPMIVSETDRDGLEQPGQKIVLAQSTVFLGSAICDLDWRARGVEAVIAVSSHVQTAVQRQFRMEATVIPPSVDGTLFQPRTKLPTIAYMPRRNPGGIKRILGRARLHGFQLLPIDGLPLEGVAERLGSAAVFLAASPSEGFGLPPLEAMASGCVVAGYAGGGGLDYMRDGENCLLAPDGDEDAAVARLERAIDMVRSGNHADLVRNGIETARRFSPERERREVVQFWTSFLSQ
jgi:hypothetical protein